MKFEKSSLNILIYLVVAVIFSACNAEKVAEPADRSVQPGVNESAPESTHPDKEEPIGSTSTPDPAVSETVQPPVEGSTVPTGAGMVVPEETITGPAFEPGFSAADCAQLDLPENACSGVTANDQWQPVVRTFDGVEMALVPAGCFMMGFDGGLPEEQPVHEVCIEHPFWIDVTEITVAEYARFLNGQDEPVESLEGWLDFLWSPLYEPTVQLTRLDDQWMPLPGRVDRPLESVKWLGAEIYCGWRSARLPTEAEWEYAARGPDNLYYPWGNEFVRENVVRVTRRTVLPDVGSRPGGASWVGALDMSTSLFEWVNSIYRPYPYSAADGREVSSMIDDTSDRVFRGSAWYHPDGMHDNVSATARFNAPPDYAAWYYGFRCARGVYP